MNRFQVNFAVRGKETVVRNMRTLQERLLAAGEDLSWNGAQHLFSRTRAVVPFKTGKLYESAYMVKISQKNFAMWAVGYEDVRVEYAWIVHEVPNRIHPVRGPSNEPKQDKYLSNPRDEMSKTWPTMVSDVLEERIRSAKMERTPRR